MALDLIALANKAQSLREEDRLLPMSPLTELNVDGDYCAYFFSGNDDTPLSTAKRKFTETAMDVRRIAGAGGRSVIHLTHPGSDKAKRYQIATVKPYQGNRESGGKKPKNWQALRLWLESFNRKVIPGTELYVHVWPDREADDGVAAAHRYAYAMGRTPAAFTRDKDFRMIYGRHITWDDLSVVEVPPGTWALEHDDKVYGLKWFYLQMIQGDGVDNIPGVPGVPKTGGPGFKLCGDGCAEKALAWVNNAAEAYEVVRSMYQTYYGAAWANAFAEQAMLLWLRNDNKADPADFMQALPLAAGNDLNAAVTAIKRRITWK